MSRPTPETDAAYKYWPSENAELVDADFARNLERERDEAMAKYAAEATDHMLAVNKLCNERDEARKMLVKSNHFLQQAEENLESIYKERKEAIEKIKRQAKRIRVLEGATNHATGTPLSVAISERNDALNQLQGWENKWKAAVGLAAIAENKCEELMEDIKNLEDQRNLAMKVIKRLEAQLPQNT